jgi:hypothetical protein
MLRLMHMHAVEAVDQGQGQQQHLEALLHTALVSHASCRR